MGSYRRVTLEDRIRLKSFLESGLTQNEIAVKLGFCKSTISREISRNKGKRGYQCKQANRQAEERQQWRSIPRKMNRCMMRTVERLLKKKWSPEQISCRLAKEGRTTVSHETIYGHVYQDCIEGGVLFAHLRFSHRKRKPRFPRKNKDRRGIIHDAVSIEKRPQGANNRSRNGHWERDTMFGKDKRNSVLLIVDRKSRYLKLGKLKRRTAVLTNTKTKELLRRLPKKTMTNDRGREFTEHKQLSNQLGIPVFFCHPYSSSERGTCENRIGVLRQYLPKGKDLKHLKHKTLQAIEVELNNRPMKCLDWKTPYEVLYGKKVALTT
jgi:transposase, IS30 family